jgi:integrase
MATYLTKRKDHEGGGWKYQRYIPPKYRSTLGGKSAFVAYHKACPKNEAEAWARSLAVQHDATLNAVRASSDKDLEAYALRGGFERLNSYKFDNNQLYSELFKVSIHPKIDPAIAHEIKDLLRLVLTADKAQRLQAEINHHAANASAVASNLSWDGLAAEWVRLKHPGKGSKAQVYKTVSLLKEVFDEVDCRRVTPQDIAKFRTHLEEKGVSADMVNSRLEHINRLYNTAASDPESPFFSVVNPAKGIRATGKRQDPKEGRPFTAKQARIVLDTAAKLRLGDTVKLKRHTEVMWMLKLMAYSGATPREVSQLQGGDVGELDGARYFHVRSVDAVTHKEHPQKSIKKAARKRMVPLHPAIADFYDHAQTFKRGEFIFGAFDYHEVNGRCAWLVSEFSRQFLAKCNLDGNGTRLTLYSFRHRFHDAMKEVRPRIDRDLQRRITGHSAEDVHASYGGDLLKVLNEEMQRVKPVAD